MGLCSLPIIYLGPNYGGNFPCSSVKNLPAVQETQVQSLAQEDLLEKEIATYSSILAWKISRTEEPGGLQSMGSQRVRHNWTINTYLNYGGGNEDNGDLLQKVLGTHCYTQCPQPCSRPPLTQHLRRRLLDTPRQVWVGLSLGHCYFLLGPGVHKVLFVPSKSLFPQSCVSSGSSMMWLMATSSKRAYAGPKSAPPRAPVPAAVHCWLVPSQETLKHRSVSVSVGSLGPGFHQVPLSMGYSRQEYESWLPCPPPGNLPDPGFKPMSPALRADSLLLNHQGSP